MNLRFGMLWHNVRHAWVVACQGIVDTGIDVTDGHAMDISLAEALEEVEEQNLAWVMQFHHQDTL